MARVELAFAFALLPALAGAVTFAQVLERTLEHEGHARHYELVRPERLASAPRLYILLHGRGGDPLALRRETRSRVDEIATGRGDLVVYPAAIAGGWNDGREDPTSLAWRERIDDRGFLRSLAERLGDEFAIPAERRVIAGFSNGGMMALRLACQDSSAFAAFVAVAANIPAAVSRSCRPERARTVIMVNGTSDPIMPWPGSPPGTHGAVRSALDTFQLFRRRLGCEPPARESSVDAVDDGTALVVLQALRCRESATVRLLQLRGGGHAWPGGLPASLQMDLGTVSRELDAAEVVTGLP